MSSGGVWAGLCKWGALPLYCWGSTAQSNISLGKLNTSQVLSSEKVICLRMCVCMCVCVFTSAHAVDTFVYTRCIQKASCGLADHHLGFIYLHVWYLPAHSDKGLCLTARRLHASNLSWGLSVGGLYARPMHVWVFFMKSGRRIIMVTASLRGWSNTDE